MIELYDKFYDWCESTFEPDMLFIIALIFIVAYIAVGICYCKLEKEHDELVSYLDSIAEDEVEDEQKDDEVEHEQ